MPPTQHAAPYRPRTARNQAGGTEAALILSPIRLVYPRLKWTRGLTILQVDHRNAPVFSGYLKLAIDEGVIESRSGCVFVGGRKEDSGRASPVDRAKTHRP